MLINIPKSVSIIIGLNPLNDLHLIKYLCPQVLSIQVEYITGCQIFTLEKETLSSLTFTYNTLYTNTCVYE